MTGVSIIIMLGFSFAGRFLIEDRANWFTVVGVISMLGVAQFGVRLLSFVSYKDGSEEDIALLESLPDYFSVIHGGLLACGKYTVFAEHILSYEKTAVLYMTNTEQRGIGELKKSLLGYECIIKTLEAVKADVEEFKSEKNLLHTDQILIAKLKGMLM